MKRTIDENTGELKPLKWTVKTAKKCFEYFWEAEDGCSRYSDDNPVVTDLRECCTILDELLDRYPNDIDVSKLKASSTGKPPSVLLKRVFDIAKHREPVSQSAS